SAAHAFFTMSILPSGNESVSCKIRPISVDLPWSTCPTKTILSGCSSCIGISQERSKAGQIQILHVPEFLLSLAIIESLSRATSALRYARNDPERDRHARPLSLPPAQ